MTIGARIKIARIQLGYTQAALALRAHLHTNAISQFECDTRKPCAENLKALSKALGCTSDYLLGLPEIQARREK